MATQIELTVGVAASDSETFDLPVPLYLAPATLEARQTDLELLRPYLSNGENATTGIYGHRLFTSGQEWGYWLIDYCTAHRLERAKNRWEDERGHRGHECSTNPNVARILARCPLSRKPAIFQKGIRNAVST